MPATPSQHAVLPVGAAAQFATQSAFEAQSTQFKYGPVVPELLPLELVAPEDVPPPDDVEPDPELLEVVVPDDEPSSPPSPEPPDDP